MEESKLQLCSKGEWTAIIAQADAKQSTPQILGTCLLALRRRSLLLFAPG
jgi:hypothetical protein